MSNDKQPAPQKQPGRPEATRVKRITFITAMNIPGAQMPRTLAGALEGDATNRARYIITFEPWMRHHRIEWYEPNKTIPSQVLNVHETRVESWEAA